MNDVAKLAGVSQPTVSRVLNSDSISVHISDETKERVMDAVKTLGYRTNVMARGLRTQRSQLIAIMIADISNGFYHLIVRAVQDVAREHNYEVLISNSDHVYENEKHFCEVVLDRGVDGVIMVPIHLISYDDLDPYLSQTDIPFVVLGQHVDHPEVDKIFVDDEKAIYEATLWLIHKGGHQNIGYVGVPDFQPAGPRRFRGYRRALEESGLPFNPAWCYSEGDFTREGGAKAIKRLHETGTMPEALIVLNDLMAIGAILALQELGYNVPEDVAVIGFDDIPEATIVRPKLTTIAQNPREIGTNLANALFQRIEHPRTTRRNIESSYKLIERDSTRRKT
ncbi:LacI family DNA-binding transcriptional regulator [Phototrophicus methaneseepsis]|uniref:LacI family DNA-binding transcriptional regulator n=1 Tax=Phototrophicus methaneseepsis TaxID=2710758 RepID=A0A7S8EBY0_9CHLR|nr:LacI family DNA-binding transcriptional regulator [Phototrophicus methaneseepsis]QPC84126.1 LacI family DNA-binding transcriptional regulator [Phototrophicus methaneseepsis]